MATIAVVPEIDSSRPKLIAPRWHTGLLVALFVGLTIGVKIAIFVAWWGLLALWRGSLRPGMIAHSGADILSGIFGI